MSLVGLAILVALMVALLVLAGLAAWAWDRRDHRRSLASQGWAHGPDGLRAFGEAWGSVAGDGPPTLRVRSSRGGLEVGSLTRASEAADEAAS